jgi:hypothetical protein
MWKTILAGTTVLVITGASFAFADRGPGRFDHAHHWRPSVADISAYADARIAALHAGLQLNADQEKNWPAVESALRDMSKQRVDRFAARKDAQRPADPIERLNRRADAIEQRGAALKKLADAAGPLYNSLDDAQKHRFTVLARLGGERSGHWRARHHGRGMNRMQQGPADGGTQQQ